MENGPGQKEDEKAKKTDDRSELHPGIMMQIGAEEKGGRMAEFSSPIVRYPYSTLPRGYTNIPAATMTEAIKDNERSIMQIGAEEKADAWLRYPEATPISQPPR
eukprot:10516286-Heterocapsa_arctica.AAC.1